MAISSSVSASNPSTSRALELVATITVFPSMWTQEAFLHSVSWRGKMICYPFNCVASLYGTVGSAVVITGSTLGALSAKVTGMALKVANCSGASEKVNDIADECLLGTGLFFVLGYRALKNSIIPGSLLNPSS